MRTDDLDIWKQSTGKDITIGQKVRISSDYEHISEWQGEYPIVGINLDPRTGKLDITLADGYELYDGWSIHDLIPA